MTMKIIIPMIVMLFASVTLAHDETMPIAVDGEIIACPMPLPATEIEGETIICGTITVPEDWDNPDGTLISITYAKAHVQLE